MKFPLQNVVAGWIDRFVEGCWSLAIAGSLILTVTWLCLNSCRRALTVLAPVAFAVLMMYGLLGIVGVPLGVATSMFGSIVLGLGIDYSIHFEAE